MDPKQQAVLFYKSLGAADERSRRLLVRSAQIQRGRAASLALQLDALKLQDDAKEQVAKLQAEIDRRKQLASNYDTLEKAIGKAILDRAELDKEKFT
jgi:hypothetical protein